MMESLTMYDAFQKGAGTWLQCVDTSQTVSVRLGLQRHPAGSVQFSQITDMHMHAHVYIWNIILQYIVQGTEYLQMCY